MIVFKARTDSQIDTELEVTLEGSSPESDPLFTGDTQIVQGQLKDLCSRLEDVEARACAPVIAVASFGTEILVGLTLDETRELQILEWDRKLGGLPPSKRHAYLMFLESLQDALTTEHQNQNQNKGQ